MRSVVISRSRRRGSRQGLRGGEVSVGVWEKPGGAGVAAGVVDEESEVRNGDVRRW